MKITFKGVIDHVEDGEREFASKQVPGQMVKHRITNIVMLYMDGKKPEYITFRGFDLPSSFPLPRADETWESPAITSLEEEAPHSYRCSFKV